MNQKDRNPQPPCFDRSEITVVHTIVQLKKNIDLCGLIFGILLYVL